MRTILELRKLLSLTNKPETDTYFAYFEKIAEVLMNKCAISKRDKLYEIVEIEFYLYTHDHQDVITYPREISAGQWFFHSSGVDLTFESNSEIFGGILIRGIRNIKNRKEQVLGPLKCVDVLWDNFDAFDNQSQLDYPIIKRKEHYTSKLAHCHRWIPMQKGKCELDKIEEWKKCLTKESINCDAIDEDLSKLVFQSPYRFIKMESIDQSLDSWKTYSAKPRDLKE